MRTYAAIVACLLLPLVLSGQLTLVLEQIPANTPAGDTIFLAGSLNDWTAADPAFSFRKGASGKLVLQLDSLPAFPFEFKLTRGSWERVETNAMGQFIDNRRCESAAPGDTLQLKVLNWDDLPINPPYGWLDIRVENLPKNTPPDASLYAVGSFNGWNTQDPDYRLQKQADGLYKVRIPLLSDTTYYKFCRGNWETIEGRRSGRARLNRSFVRTAEQSLTVGVRIESWEDLAGSPINLYTFFLLLAAFQGLLLILAINTLHDNNRAANRVLSLLLLLLSIALVGRVSTYDREIFQWMPGLLLLPDFIYFLYAPIFLLYINRLLRLPGRGRMNLYWLHFLPFLIQLAICMPLILMSKEALIAKVVDQELREFFAWSAGIAFLVNAAYWWGSHRAIRRYERESGDNLAALPNLRFLRVVMWLQLVCLFIWSSAYLIGGLGLLLGRDLSPLTDLSIDLLWLAFSGTAFFLGYYTMRQPEIFKLPAVDEPPSEEGKIEQERAASMSDREFQTLKLRLEQIMAERQPYHNANLTLNALAEETGVSPHSLSRVINEGCGMNFNDFVNSYRIAEFKRLLQQEEYRRHTLLAIAFEVGFNSKSAFNRSFKKLENCTPREYLQEIGKPEVEDGVGENRN